MQGIRLGINNPEQPGKPVLQNISGNSRVFGNQFELREIGFKQESQQSADFSHLYEKYYVDVESRYINRIKHFSAAINEENSY
jgi:hypothetical protein